MSAPQLNRVHSWSPIPWVGLSTKKYMKYTHKNGTGVVYRYAKNYVIDKKQFSLCLITTEKSKTKVEKFLDKIAKDVNKTIDTDKFIDLNIEYK